MSLYVLKMFVVSLALTLVLELVVFVCTTSFAATSALSPVAAINTASESGKVAVEPSTVG